MPRVEHWPYQKLFQKWRVFILIIQFFVLVLWMCFLLPDTVLNWMISRFAKAGESASGLRAVLEGLLPVGGAGIGVLVLLHLTNHLVGDILLAQHTRAAQYFRGEFPTITIGNDLGLMPEDARKLWHDYYDTWQFTSSPHFQRFKETTRAGFVCRSVYISTYLLWALSSVGAGIVATKAYLDDADGFWGQYLFLVILFCAALGITALNRLPKGTSRPPTGCWKIWRDRCTENLAAFRSDLQSHGSNLDAFRGHLRQVLRDLHAVAEDAKISWLTAWTE